MFAIGIGIGIGRQRFASGGFVGLLDTYPGASAAYSLRQLSSTYSGDAIRVRRTNLDEMDIGFDALGNLDTSALLAFTGTGALDNGFITTWYDQSGNAINATQATALNQPQIVSSGSVILESGKPTVQFDGTNDELLISSLSSVSLESIYLTNTPSLDVNGILGASSATPYLAISSTDARYRTAILNTLQPLTSNNNLSLNSFNRSSNVISAFRNSVVSTTTLTGDALTSIDRIGRRGGSAAFNGKLSEFVCYNFDQAANRVNIELNIITYYAL